MKPSQRMLDAATVKLLRDSADLIEDGLLRTEQMNVRYEASPIGVNRPPVLFSGRTITVDLVAAAQPEISIVTVEHGEVTGVEDGR